MSFGVPRGRPSPKLAITVDADVHEQVIHAAASEGMSVSAWMTSAARRALLVRDGLSAIAEWEAEHGPFSDTELAASSAGSCEGATSSRSETMSPTMLGLSPAEQSPPTSWTSTSSPSTLRCPHLGRERPPGHRGRTTPTRSCLPHLRAPTCLVCCPEWAICAAALTTDDGSGVIRGMGWMAAHGWRPSRSAGMLAVSRTPCSAAAVSKGAWLTSSGQRWAVCVAQCTHRAIMA